MREGSGIHALQPSIIPQDFPDACVAGKLCILGEERYAASVYRGMEGAQAENVDLSPLDLEETHHGRERRCFSGAVGTNDSNLVTPKHSRRKTVDNLLVRVRKGDLFQTGHQGAAALRLLDS